MNEIKVILESRGLNIGYKSWFMHEGVYVGFSVRGREMIWSWYWVEMIGDY